MVEKKLLQTLLVVGCLLGVTKLMDLRLKDDTIVQKQIKAFWEALKILAPDNYLCPLYTDDETFKRHFSFVDTVSGRFVQQYFQATRDTRAVQGNHTNK
jgi:hypothetical protein